MGSNYRQINAAVTETDQETAIRLLTLEAPRADEVIVRIVATGICRTDLNMNGSDRVSKPIVLGHEGAGIVEAVGADVCRVKPGQRVVLSGATCGSCKPCRSGTPSHCRKGLALNFGGARLDSTTALSDGGRSVGSHFFGQSSFATYAVAYERSCVPVTSDVPLELLGPLGCGIQTGAGAILNTLQIRPGQSVAIIGAGAVGLSAIMAAVIAGADRIVALVNRQGRGELARSLGATDIIDTSSKDVLENGVAAALLAIEPDGFDATVDTSGHVATLHNIVAALGVKGRLALVSSAHGADVTFNAGSLISNGRQVMGVAGGDADAQIFLPKLIDWYRAGRFPFDRLLSFYDFDEIGQAMNDMQSGKAIKPVLRMGPP